MGHTHHPASAPGDKLEVGGQLDVRAQQGEQAQEEVHDLQGQEGQQVLLPVLKGRPGVVRGPLHKALPCSLMAPRAPWPTVPFHPGELGALLNHLWILTEVTPWGSTCLPLSEALGMGRR